MASLVANVRLIYSILLNTLGSVNGSGYFTSHYIPLHGIAIHFYIDTGRDGHPSQVFLREYALCPLSPDPIANLQIY
jgi:hypothetical protein